MNINERFCAPELERLEKTENICDLNYSFLAIESGIKYLFKKYEFHVSNVYNALSICTCFLKVGKIQLTNCRALDSGGAGGVRAPPEFGGSEKGRGLISAYQSLAITANTSGFKKLSTALN